MLKPDKSISQWAPCPVTKLRFQGSSRVGFVRFWRPLIHVPTPISYSQAGAINFRFIGLMAAAIPLMTRGPRWPGCKAPLIGPKMLQSRAEFSRAIRAGSWRVQDPEWWIILRFVVEGLTGMHSRELWVHRPRGPKTDFVVRKNKNRNIWFNSLETSLVGVFRCSRNIIISACSPRYWHHRLSVWDQSWRSSELTSRTYSVTVTKKVRMPCR